MGNWRCKRYIGPKDAGIAWSYLKHSWVPQGNRFQICVHCKYAKTMTQTFRRSWNKLDKELDKIKYM